MLSLAVIPGLAGSATLKEIRRSPGAPDAVRIRTLAVGICGTDREILAGHYGTAPPGAQHLILGHESLGEVLAAPTECGLTAGDLVVAIVRRPDPLPCVACASGEWDMCRSGLYTEHGIKELDGFCVEEFLIEPRFCVRVDAHLRETGVLLEPASVVAKAWDHIERIGARTRSWRPTTVLVTGAGTVGLLAALMARQRGCELHVYDRQRGGMKRDLVVRLGGTYHDDSIEHACSTNPDVIIECTGAPEVIAAIISRNAPASIVCLAGLSSGSHRLSYDFTAFNRTMVLENDVLFGSVNANRMHYELGATALSRADPGWLRNLITRRVALADWQQAVERHPGDIKVVIDFTL